MTTQRPSPAIAMTRHSHATEQPSHAPAPTDDLLASHRQALQTAVLELGLPLPTSHLNALADRIQHLICQRHGGTTPYIPSLSSLQRQERNSAIRRDYARGLGLAGLACRYHLSESRVRQILALS